MLCAGVAGRWSNFQNFSYWENFKCQILRPFFSFFLRLFSFCLKTLCLLLEIPVVGRGQGEVSPQLCRPLRPHSSSKLPLFSFPNSTLTLREDWRWEVGAGGRRGEALLDKDSSGLVAQPSPSSAESISSTPIQFSSSETCQHLF